MAGWSCQLARPIRAGLHVPDRRTDNPRDEVQTCTTRLRGFPSSEHEPGRSGEAAMAEPAIADQWVSCGALLVAAK